MFFHNEIIKMRKIYILDNFDSFSIHKFLILKIVFKFIPISDLVGNEFWEFLKLVLYFYYGGYLLVFRRIGERLTWMLNFSLWTSAPVQNSILVSIRNFTKITLLLSRIVHSMHTVWGPRRIVSGEVNKAF